MLGLKNIFQSGILKYNAGIYIVYLLIGFRFRVSGFSNVPCFAEINQLGNLKPETRNLYSTSTHLPGTLARIRSSYIASQATVGRK